MEGELRRRRADVIDGNLIAKEYVSPQVIRQRLALARLADQKQTARQAETARSKQDARIGVGKYGRLALINSQLADIVSRHAIDKLESIAAFQEDATLMRAIEQNRARLRRRQFGCLVAVMQRYLVGRQARAQRCMVWR